MINIHEQLELAKRNDFPNWIDPNNCNRGWYTCLLTGQKFRGEKAYNMLADQDQAIADYLKAENAGKDAQDYEQEITNDIENEIEDDIEEDAEEAQSKKPVALVQMVEVVGGFFTEVHLTPTLNNHKATGNKKQIKTVIINCIDCGTPREIKVQDTFQVKRCPHCQAEHRKAMRRANYKAKKEAERKAKEAQTQVEQPRSERKEEGEILSTQQQIEIMAQQGTLFSI